MSALMGALRIILLTLLLAAARTGGEGAAHAADLFDPTLASGLVEMRAGAETHDLAEALGGNPVRTVPLERLAATRARPLFTPSRRPPSPPLKASPPAPAASATATAPDPPRVALIGTVVGVSDAYGIFRIEATGSVVRLRTGESYNGWVLRSVRRRDAELEKDHGTEVLVLSARGQGSGAIVSVGRSVPVERAPDSALTTARPTPLTGSALEGTHRASQPGRRRGN
ncbi:hypothetical protein ACI7BZ_21835 [Xanthobacter sp. AM11]|uniref:hypothetical protein n=1 Tax=Xanthobacter sp. AM11 TaxID=3380643 RepID=UPI0039BF5CA4